MSTKEWIVAVVLLLVGITFIPVVVDLAFGTQPTGVAALVVLVLWVAAVWNKARRR